MPEPVEGGAARVADEATGIAASFVQSFGLTDIVFGSFLLYWLRLVLRSTDWSVVLPGTGYSWVDVLLLAAAAALVGKVLSLVVQWEGAFLDHVVDRGQQFAGWMWMKMFKKPGPIGYTKTLREALAEYRTVLGRPAIGDQHDLRDLAESYLTAGSPDGGAKIQRIRINASIAHSGAVVTLLYGLYFRSQHSVPYALSIAVFCFVAVLVVLGIATQLDYVKTLGDELEVLLRPKASS